MKSWDSANERLIRTFFLRSNTCGIDNGFLPQVFEWLKSLGLPGWLIWLIIVVILLLVIWLVWRLFGGSSGP